MKKFFLILISFVTMSAFVSCSDKPVTEDKLPKNAKTFLDTYFKGIEVFSVIKEMDGDYDVELVDGTEIDFLHYGEWKKVDCHGRPIPVGFYPASITTYVATHYPDAFIDEIQFEHNRYKVGLYMLVDVELIFDSNGNYVGVDD